MTPICLFLFLRYIVLLELLFKMDNDDLNVDENEYGLEEQLVAKMEELEAAEEHIVDLETLLQRYEAELRTQNEQYVHVNNVICIKDHEFSGTTLICNDN